MQGMRRKLDVLARWSLLEMLGERERGEAARPRGIAESD